MLKLAKMMKSPWCRCVLALLAMSCTLVYQAGQHLCAAVSTPEALWESATAAWDANRMLDAEIALEELLLLRPQDPGVLTALGAVHHRKGDLDLALELYEASLALDERNSELLMNLGQLLFDMEDFDRAVHCYESALALNATLTPTLEHSVALAYHHVGNFSKAEFHFRRATDGSAVRHFDFGVTLVGQGKILEAADEYNRALGIDPTLAEAWINIAALHHLHGEVNDSIRPYKRVIDLLTASPSLKLMAMMNVGVAYEQMDDVVNAIKWCSNAQALLPTVSFPDAKAKRVRELQLIANLCRAKRTAADWGDAESLFDSLWHALTPGQPGPILPFDSLLSALTPLERKQLAVVRSRQFEVENAPKLPVPLQHGESGGMRLHVGVLSYDFNDHPTTHLISGLFAETQRQHCKLIAFGYGRDDGNEYRKQIIRTADAFVDLTTASFDDSAARIRDERVHILMDAQGHTHGGRMAIVARSQVPITVNYLVFPGTSGARFVDYIVTDRHVTPPAELAEAITEKLALLPDSYQVNYYRDVAPHRSVLWTAATADLDPTVDVGDAFVFVSFNKVDKLEPVAFAVWMGILRRVPDSVLLLLDPGRPGKATVTSEQTKKNVIKEARAYGVNPRRVWFVRRVPKAEHLRRHRAGGLFLDTFIYGAHSTATDALYAGLPVLTLAGDAFASRVGVSLLRNANTPELVTHSCREFEDVAVFLATQPTALDAVRQRVRSPAVLFDTPRHTASLEAAWRAMHDVYTLTNRTLHLAVGPPS